MAKKRMVSMARSEAFGVFRDAETDWTFRRILERMGEGAAEIGECLSVACKISETDSDSWRIEWTTIAEKLEKTAEASLKTGSDISARECYLRASTYYAAAEYGTDPVHPEFHKLWRKSVHCFLEAAALFNPPVELIKVPYEEKLLPGYFWRPDNTDKKRPTLIAAGGNDSSLEEVFLTCGPAAVRRGYNFFAFEHPGHRGAVHLYKDCTKIPNYEAPYANAIDVLKSLPGVNEKIALTGFSFGGYIACRVAAHEPRIKAVIPNSPIIDSYAVTMAFWSGLITKIPMSLLARIMEKKLKRKPVIRALKHYNDWAGGLYPTELSPEEKAEAGFSLLKQMKVDASKITVPVLAMISDGDGPVLMEQTQQFLANISSVTKDMYHFTLEKDGCDDHCQLDNRAKGNQIMFDWLDKIFQNHREKVNA